MQKSNESINSEFRIKLQNEFSRRVRSNERYSVRSFANHLGLDSSTLSQILSGKRSLSEKKINLLCEKIGLVKPKKTEKTAEFTTIDLDSFAVISDWYHFAILDLTLNKNFKSDVKWIARKLSIKQIDAFAAVQRLKRLGLLTEVDGVLKKDKAFYTNYEEGDSSAALKEYQRQIVKKALDAIDNCPQDRKDITSITIAANSSKIKEAKSKIKNFRRELCDFLEQGDSDSVFHFCLQLYPVTDLEN